MKKYLLGAALAGLVVGAGYLVCRYRDNHTDYFDEDDDSFKDDLEEDDDDLDDEIENMVKEDTSEDNSPIYD